MEGLMAFWAETGIAHFTGGQVLMMAVGALLLYLAIVRGFEPLLLLPIGFGTVLANIPHAGFTEEGGMLYYSIATENDGTVWTWGTNTHGQLANGTTTNSDSPILAIGLCEQVVGVSQEIFEYQSPIVFPNPSKNEAILQLEIPIEDAELRLYNANGLAVKIINNQSGQQIHLHRENLPSGIYMVSLTVHGLVVAMEKIVFID